MPWATPYPLASFWFITPTHSHTHTLCKATFIRVVMPVKSKTDNWRVPGVYKNNKHKHEVCNNIRWQSMACFNCFLVWLCRKIRMFENTRVENQNNTAMFRSPRVRRCVRRTIRVNWHLEHFPSLRCASISASKQWNAVYYGIFMYIQCLFEMLMLATSEELSSAVHGSFNIASGAKELGKD